ncbi:MAG: glycosyl hydrolase [Chitinophagaceae bacterium]
MIDMRKKAITLAATLLLAGTSFAQLQWPAVSTTTKPWTRWWWQGSAVSEAGVAASMYLYKNAGLGGLEITPIFGVKGTEAQFLPFLSPRWVDMFQFTLKEAKAVGLGIDMATGTGWPFGGPWIGADDAAKYLAHKKYDVAGGQEWSQQLEYIANGFVRTANGKPLSPDQLKDPITANENLQALAIDQVRFPKPLKLIKVFAYGENGQSIDISNYVTDGKDIKWNAPAGNWKVYALFEGLHGKMVERSAPGGEGNVIDHFEEKALDNYLAKFNNSLAKTDMSHLRAWFNDSYEVDDARGQSDWTPNFLEAFSKRRGYRLEKFLPDLFSSENTDTHIRVLHDYRLTISDLILEKFTQPWHNWAAKQGKLIRNQSHGSPANILDLYSAIDIPETEGTNILRYKFATSAAHVAGKPLASAEAATWLNDHFISTLADVKAVLDKYFLGGVNHIFYHGTNYSPQNDPWPGWLFYAAVHFHPNNPFWKDFAWLNQYVTRCQSFLQAGKPSNDVLLYFPFHDRLMEPVARGGMLHHFDGMEGFDGTPFEHAASWMMENGYAFDLFSDKQLESFEATNGHIQTGGAEYQVILVPQLKSMPLATIKKLYALARKGATIIFAGHLPQNAPGMANQEDVKAFFRKVMQELSITNDPATGIFTATTGKGKLLMSEGEKLADLLKAAAVRKEALPKGVQSIRRLINKGEYHFIANTGTTAVDQWIPVSKKFPYAALFNPMNGEAGVLQPKLSKDSMLVHLSILPGETVVLQVSESPISGKMYPSYKIAGTPQPIGKTWKLEFVKGGPTLPKPVTVTKPGSWTELPGEEYKNFSGTAKYTTSFARPATKTPTGFWKLDLGKIGESAEIMLNGKKITTLLGPTYEVVIPASAFAAKNTLEILVSNSMANRIIFLEKSGVQWKKFYNINFPANKAENRGADGLFSALKWTPFASGLLGEVSLTPVRNTLTSTSSLQNKPLK